MKGCTSGLFNSHRRVFCLGAIQAKSGERVPDPNADDGIIRKQLRSAPREIGHQGLGRKLNQTRNPI